MSTRTIDDTQPPRLTRPLQPVLNMIAALPGSVHRKLLAGFLATAVLLVGMAANAVIILDRLNQQSQNVTALQQQRDEARQMLYSVTVQMHYRAMALLTHDDTYNAKIATAKQTFAHLLDQVERQAGPGMDAFSARSRTAAPVSMQRARRCCPFTRRETSRPRSMCTSNRST